MNDFTKDELELILNWRNSILYTKKPTIEVIHENHRLGNKIQSMIDNYCDSPCKHEWIRLRLLSQKDYDFCEHCLHVMRVR